MKDKDTPLKMVRNWEKTIPGIYAQLDSLRDAKADGEIWWPDHCSLPINAVHTYLVDTLGLSKEKAAEVAAEITACWTWRQNKIVYSFDPELVLALAEQVRDIQDEEKLPFDLLLHFPFPCIYVKTPNLIEHIDGFFAWVEYDVNRKANELRVQMVAKDYMWSIPMVMHMIPGGSINEWVADTLKTTQEVSGRDDLVDFDRNPGLAPQISVMLICIEMLLYITAVNADIVDVQPTAAPRPRPCGTIQDKASEVRQKVVGMRVGSVLRRASQARTEDGNEATGRTVRPHARRGHWHHYWTGPMDGDRELILKWTAPTFIHPEGGTEDDIVIHPVK